MPLFQKFINKHALSLLSGILLNNINNNNKNDHFPFQASKYFLSEDFVSLIWSQFSHPSSLTILILFLLNSSVFVSFNLTPTPSLSHIFVLLWKPFLPSSPPLVTLIDSLRLNLDNLFSRDPSTILLPSALTSLVWVNDLLWAPEYIRE